MQHTFLCIDGHTCGNPVRVVTGGAPWGKLSVGDDFIHESIIGSIFSGRVEDAAKVGDYEAIIPSIGGWARVTGFNTIFVDDRDPYVHGFVVT